MTSPAKPTRVTRRELLRYGLQSALAFPALNVLVATGSCGGKSTAPPAAAVSDDEFLDQIERAGFLFFWEQASPATGQVKDRALATGNDNRGVASIAATGFGLTALCIAHK